MARLGRFAPGRASQAARPRQPRSRAVGESVMRRSPAAAIDACHRGRPASRAASGPAPMV